MNNKDIEQEYTFFLENLNIAYCLGLDFIDKINVIAKRQKNNYNLEWQLHYLRLYLEQMDEIIAKIENNICFKEVINNENLVEKVNNNLLILPLYPDVDIYVDINDSIKDIWKK